MTSVIVSQLGSRMHYAVPRVLDQSGTLNRFFTDIIAHRGLPRLTRIVPPVLRPAALRRLAGRSPSGISDEKITTFQRFGFSYALRRLKDHDGSRATEISLWAAEQFSRLVIQHGFENATTFYGISGECLEQIEYAKSKGLKTIVEQINAPRVYLEKLMAEESDRFPEWASQKRSDPFIEAYSGREKDEWRTADLIICGSEFVRAKLLEFGIDARRCAVVPYGVDTRQFSVTRRPHLREKLRVLSVGAVGLRKGSQYIFEAAGKLSKIAEFRLVGPCLSPPKIVRSISSRLEVVGAIPRAEILSQYAWADVFLLPSICEGSATVIYEALAAGLPVICTSHAGSVVQHELEGLIIPIRSSDAIVDSIERLSNNRNLLEYMATNAKQRALKYNLEEYGRQLGAIVTSL